MSGKEKTLKSGASVLAVAAALSPFNAASAQPEPSPLLEGGTKFGYEARLYNAFEATGVDKLVAQTRGRALVAEFEQRVYEKPSEIQVFSVPTNYLAKPTKLIAHLISNPRHLIAQGKPAAHVCLEKFEMMPQTTESGEKMFERKVFVHNVDVKGEFTPDTAYKGPMVMIQTASQIAQAVPQPDGSAKKVFRSACQDYIDSKLALNPAKGVSPPASPRPEAASK